MNFTANLVKTNSSPALSLGLSGAGLFCCSILFFALDIFETIALYLSIGGIIIALIGALASIKKTLIEVDSATLFFDAVGISINSTRYLYNEISMLQFHFDSFYSQSSYGYFTENAGRIEYGMGNRLRFKSGETDVTAVFYLSHQIHANSFFILLRELEASNIAYEITYRQNPF